MVYLPALWEWKLQKKRGFCTASWRELLLLLVKSKNIVLWPCHPLRSSLKAGHCVCGTHLAAVRCSTKLPLPPNHHFYARWRAEVYRGTRNLAKLVLQSALPPCSILPVKHKLILCCCSTQDSAKCSTVTRALTHFDSITISVFGAYILNERLLKAVLIWNDPSEHCQGQ